MLDVTSEISADDPDYMAKQAAFVRDLIRNSDVFDAPVDMDNPDAVLVAAFCLGAVTIDD